MKRLYPWTAAAICLWLTGCASAPFPAPEPFAKTDIAPEQVPAAFARRLAPRYELAQALVFRFYLREIAALGYVSVDVPDRSFAMACLNPVGIKLFELVGTNGDVAARFAAPEIEKHGGKLAQAAGADLMRAYFDLSPPAGTPGRARKGRLTFAAEDSAGRTEYRYGGSDGRLAEKVRFEGRRVRWSVEYRGFRETEAGWIPADIVIRNRAYGYRLVISSREMER